MTGHCLIKVLFPLELLFVVFFYKNLKILLLHCWCNKNNFSGNYTWTRSGENLPELQFRCVSGAFTHEIHLNFQLPELGSGKFTWTWFRVHKIHSFLVLEVNYWHKSIFQTRYLVPDVHMSEKCNNCTSCNVDYMEKFELFLHISQLFLVPIPIRCT